MRLGCVFPLSLYEGMLEMLEMLDTPPNQTSTSAVVRRKTIRLLTNAMTTCCRQQQQQQGPADAVVPAQPQHHTKPDMSPVLDALQSMIDRCDGVDETFGAWDVV